MGAIKNWRKGLIGLILGCVAFWACPAAPAAVVVRAKSHTAHGTLVNRHVLHARFAAKSAGVRRAVVRTAKPVVHHRATRARRTAKAHHARHRTGGVMGHVYNAAGEPVANAKVAVARSGHARRAHNRHLHAGRTAVTDNSGHYVLRGVAAGGHRLVASKTGIGKAAKTVHVRGGATRTGVSIKLASAHHKHKRHHHHKTA